MKYQIKDLKTNKLVVDECTKGVMEFNAFISADIYANAFYPEHEILTVCDGVVIAKSRSL